MESGISQLAERSLPHRDPFLWVSRLVERSEDGLSGSVELDVSEKLDLFQGHFPGNPVFPGVIQIEFAAQACLWVFMGELPKDSELPQVLFRGIESFKFKKAVKPPAVLTAKVKCEATRSGGYYKWKCEIFQGDELMSLGVVSNLLLSSPNKEHSQRGL